MIGSKYVIPNLKKFFFWSNNLKKFELIHFVMPKVHSKTLHNRQKVKHLKGLNDRLGLQPCNPIFFSFLVFFFFFFGHVWFLLWRHFLEWFIGSGWTLELNSCPLYFTSTAQLVFSNYRLNHCQDSSNLITQHLYNIPRNVWSPCFSIA